MPSQFRWNKVECTIFRYTLHGTSLLSRLAPQVRNFCQSIPNYIKWARQTHCELNRALGFRATEGWHFPLWLRAMLCYLDYAECIKPDKEVLFEMKIIVPKFETFRINPYFCSHINNILTFYRYGNNKEKNPRRG